MPMAASPAGSAPPPPSRLPGWLQRTHSAPFTPGSPAGPGAQPSWMPAGLGQPITAGGYVRLMQPPTPSHAGREGGEGGTSTYHLLLEQDLPVL